MSFDVLITAEALHDLDRLTEFIRTNGSVDTARKWFDGIYSTIESLADMPARCPLAPEADSLETDVRLLLHGRRSRLYKIYFQIQFETPSAGTVRILHVRHWARKPIQNVELEDLRDD